MTTYTIQSPAGQYWRGRIVKTGTQYTSPSAARLALTRAERDHPGMGWTIHPPMEPSRLAQALALVAAGTHTRYAAAQAVGITPNQVYRALARI